jgi:hypothetical protein
MGAVMPRLAKEMSALEVKRLRHPGQSGNAVFFVGGVPGLMLQVTPTGGRTWLLRTMVGARRREIGLGGYPEVSLADARDRARGARETIRGGVDPVEERKAARSALAAAQRRGLTFSAAVERFLPTRLEEFSNPKHRAQWRSTLDTYAKPTLGDMLVQDIEVVHVLGVLEPIWLTKTETANRVRTRIEAILSWATVAGHRKGENPARWKDNLAALLPKQGKVARVENNPAISLTDAPAWFGALQMRDGISARALEFLAMTAARSGEVRGAAWSEVDLETGMWTIPAERMNLRLCKDRARPLSRPAASNRGGHALARDGGR